MSTFDFPAFTEAELIIIENIERMRKAEEALTGKSAVPRGKKSAAKPADSLMTLRRTLNAEIRRWADKLDKDLETVDLDELLARLGAGSGNREIPKTHWECIHRALQREVNYRVVGAQKMHHGGRDEWTEEQLQHALQKVESSAAHVADRIQPRV